MKLLAPFLLCFVFCMIGVESANLEKLLFPSGFDADVKLDRAKRAAPLTYSSSECFYTLADNWFNFFKLSQVRLHPLTLVRQKIFSDILQFLNIFFYIRQIRFHAIHAQTAGRTFQCTAPFFLDIVSLVKLSTAILRTRSAAVSKHFNSLEKAILLQFWHGLNLFFELK